MNITKNQLLTYTAILFTGLLFGWLIFGGSHEVNSHEGHDHQTTTEDGEEVWTCSMHPSVREDGPGSCPICGMDLIPASSEEIEENDYSMVMTQASMNLADIQTTPVIRKIPRKEIHLPGRVAVDERRISYVTAHFEGRIQNVKIDYTGATITEGEVMATIYSPELVSAQRELLEAVRVRDRNPGLYESAVRKFKLWEFTDEQIQHIIDSGEVMRNMEILSPVNGYVMERNVVDEQHVMEGTVIYEVANLDHLWVTLEAYEEDLNWLSEGSSIEFKTRSNPGRTYQASVDYIDPTFDPQSRTIKVRANVENGDHSLRPDMLVSGRLMANMQDEKLMVPASAVLWTGPRSLVYVKDQTTETPRFEVKEVELGSRAGDYYVIEEGLEEGQQVVFNGAFRLDSEMQLADRFSMMNRQPGSGAMPVHDHGAGEMEMDDQEMEQDTDNHSGHEQEEKDHESHSDLLMEEDLETIVPDYLQLREALTNDDFGKARLLMEMFSEEAFSDIEDLREEFKVISEMLVERVEEEGYDGELYKHYCPMYEGGSNWISDREEIENPFYGNEMHDCGETVETL
ncbi:MAG: efflux RND transporter periplasmic adaptor subunit [Balneolaceae bacterium]